MHKYLNLYLIRVYIIYVYIYIIQYIHCIYYVYIYTHIQEIIYVLNMCVCIHSVCWSYHIKSPLWWLLWNGCAWTSRNAGASILDETCNTRILRSENIAVNCPGDSLFTWGVLQIGVPIKKSQYNPCFAWGDKGWFWGTLGLRHTIWDDWDSMIWCKVWGSYGRLQ
jgi:hypothetical protein